MRDWMLALCGLLCLGATGDRLVDRGEELFARRWTPEQGLGPLFNAERCVDCHRLGGAGGAGPSSSDTLTLAYGSPFRERTRLLHEEATAPGWDAFRRDLVLDVVLDEVDPGAQRGPTGRLLRRNTPALFGAGAIDAIPAEAIGGEVARFGWKGEVASLREFVVKACAMEMGLASPGQGTPRPEDGRVVEVPPELSDRDVEALVAWVASLPVPPDVPDHPGREVFVDVGCASCHTPSLGGVDGLYSDLRRHDLGLALADRVGAMYYGAPGAPSGFAWRTPPLWGVADSGPWLHDGRADTLEEAIAWHGGEARAVVRRWARLPHRRREALLAFLQSLRAPDTTRRPASR